MCLEDCYEIQSVLNNEQSLSVSVYSLLTIHQTSYYYIVVCFFLLVLLSNSDVPFSANEEEWIEVSI